MSWLLGTGWKRSVGNIPSPSCSILSNKVLWHWPETTKPQPSWKSRPPTWVGQLFTQTTLPETHTGLTRCAFSFLLFSHVWKKRRVRFWCSWIDLLTLPFLYFVPPPSAELKVFTFDGRHTKAKLSASMAGDHINLTPKQRPAKDRNGKVALLAFQKMRPSACLAELGAPFSHMLPYVAMYVSDIARNCFCLFF